MIHKKAWHWAKPHLVSHWDRKYRHHGVLAHAVLVFDLMLLSFLGMLVVGGIFAAYILPVFPAPRYVRLDAGPPEKAVSGQETTLTIRYANETQETLGCALLKVQMPEMFFPTTNQENEPLSPCAAKPIAQANDDVGTIVRRHLGDIPSGASGEVTFKGVGYGRIGETQSAYAELYYWQAGQTTPTRVVSRAEWSISDSLLSLSLAPAENIVQGRRTTLTVRYGNKTDQPLEGVFVRLTPPEVFLYNGSTLAPTSKYLWKLPDMAGHAEAPFSIYGTLRAGGRTTFTATAFIVRDGKEAILDEVRVNTDARATGFELSQDLQPETMKSLSPGQDMRVVVHYANNGSRTLTNVRVALEPDRNLIEAAAPSGLVWTMENAPQLASIAPGASGDLVASFKIASTFPKEMLAAGAHPMLSISAHAEYTLDDDPATPVQDDTPLVTIPVSSLLSVKAAAFYYTKDGEQLGIGPLPPKVGDRTKYRVVVYVTNTTNEVTDGWFEAYLPYNVEWTGRYSVTSGESMDYFASTGRVRWKIGTIPAFADGTSIGASFEVALTPGADDVGTAPLLVKKITVTGLDAATGAKLTALSGDLSTVLEFDARAKNKDTVEK